VRVTHIEEDEAHGPRGVPGCKAHAEEGHVRVRDVRRETADFNGRDHVSRDHACAEDTLHVRPHEALPEDANVRATCVQGLG